MIVYVKEEVKRTMTHFNTIRYAATASLGQFADFMTLCHVSTDDVFKGD